MSEVPTFGPRTFDDDALGQLRPRERDIVLRVARGLTSKQVARELGGISPRTVQKHRENAMRKLGARCMADLMRMVCRFDPDGEWEGSPG